MKFSRIDMINSPEKLTFLCLESLVLQTTGMKNIKPQINADNF